MQGIRTVRKKVWTLSVSGDRSLSLKKRATITQSYRKKTDFNSIPKDFFSQHLKKKNFLLCNNNSSGASSNLIINCIYHWVALFLRDKPMAERFQDRNTMQKVQMKNTV